MRGGGRECANEKTGVWQSRLLECVERDLKKKLKFVESICVICKEKLLIRKRERERERERKVTRMSTKYFVPDSLRCDTIASSVIKIDKYLERETKRNFYVFFLSKVGFMDFFSRYLFCVAFNFRPFMLTSTGSELSFTN